MQQDECKMKKSAFLKIVNMAVIAMIISFFLAGCADDPANKVIGGGGGDDDGNGGGNGGGGITPTVQSITIRNNTGFTISDIRVKQSTATNWGDNLWGYSSLSDGQSRTLTFSQSLLANSEYDVRLIASSGGQTFRKYRVTVSNNMTITFTNNDLNDGSDLPAITVQNRSGVSFNSVHIRPSSSSDWGVSFGSISNNSDLSVNIPVPPSSYTVFDIQMRSANPTNTYTKSNVTISDGQTVTFTSADSDNPLIGPPIIVIQNSTDYTVSDIRIKPSTATNWGDNLWGYSSLSDGQSRTFTLSQPLSTESIYDVRLTASSGGHTFRKYRVTISDGMILTFTTANDLDDGSDLPAITVQNRSGVSFNSVNIKPSASSDWGVSFGSISNNSDLSVSIPVPPSSYTAFDIQMRSANPTNTYTKSNVTISDGITITYTSADSDNPLITSPIIVIQNSTGYTISDIRIKPSTVTDWGNNLWGYSSLADGQSRTFTLSQPLSVESVYDVRLAASSGGHTFTKSSLAVSEGMILVFSGGDLE